MSQVLPSSPLTIELIPDTDQGGFTARIPDVPVYGEGTNEEDAISDLKKGLKTYIEIFGLEDTLSRLTTSSFRWIEWNELFGN